MDTIKQRIAIAESIGYEPIKRETRKGNPSPDGVVLKYEACEGGGWVSWEPVPHFTEDLNAMHKAEKRLTAAQKLEYAKNLHKTVTLGSWIFSATAAQRAEAYLKTIGKWEEAE